MNSYPSSSWPTQNDAFVDFLSHLFCGLCLTGLFASILWLLDFVVWGSSIFWGFIGVWFLVILFGPFVCLYFFFIGRKKGLELEWWRVGKDLRGVKGVENRIKIYCIDFFLN